MIFSNDLRLAKDDPILEIFHNSRETPISAVVVKDNPPMHGFGKELKIGDIVIVKGTVSRGDKFQVSIPAQCAFYDYEYFKPV